MFEALCKAYPFEWLPRKIINIIIYQLSDRELANVTQTCQRYQSFSFFQLSLDERKYERKTINLKEKERSELIDQTFKIKMNFS